MLVSPNYTHTCPSKGEAVGDLTQMEDEEAM